MKMKLKRKDKSRVRIVKRIAAIQHRFESMESNFMPSSIFISTEEHLMSLIKEIDYYYARLHRLRKRLQKQSRKQENR